MKAPAPVAEVTAQALYKESPINNSDFYFNGANTTESMPITVFADGMAFPDTSDLNLIPTNRNHNATRAEGSQRPGFIRLHSVRSRQETIPTCTDS